MSITRDFKLSLVAGRSVPLVINANQYDDGEVWRFTLLDENGQKYSPSTGSIIGLKSDGHLLANAGTVSSTGLVIIAETEQMTAAVGKNFYELLIDDDTHGTANFIVFVEPRPGADGTPSDSDLAVFQEAIDAAAQIGDASELVDDVAVLKSRMDEFTTLTDGSTTGDAELADIRVGADGTTYPNAGDAVRGQVSDLKNALTANDDCLFVSLKNYDSGVMNIPARFVRGTVLSSDGSAYTDGYLYRIVMPNKIIFDRAVKIQGKAGYRVAIATFNNDDTFNEYTEISTNYLIINANTPFRLGVRKEGVTSGLANIAEYYAVPHFSSFIYTQVVANTNRISALEDMVNVYDVGTGYDFTKLKDITEYISTNDIKNSIVYVHEGVYDLTSEYGSAYLDAIPNGDNHGYGLHVGNNTHYIFEEGAEITFDYQGSNQYCADFFSPFNINGSVTLENANITVKNARYCVHEDLPTSSETIPDSTTVKYINCVMNHQGRTLPTTGNHSAYACIGGGCNKNTLSIIDGGYYTNVATTWIYPISYHNYDGAIASRILLKDVWMSRGVRLAQLASHTSEVDVQICGCYMPAGIQKTENTDTYFNIIKWNNIES